MGDTMLMLARLAPGPALLHGKAPSGAASYPIHTRIHPDLIGPDRIECPELELPHYGARGTSRGCPLKHRAIGFRDGDGYTGVGHRRAIGTYTRGDGHYLAPCIARLIGCQGDTETRDEGYCRRGRGGGGRVSAVCGGHTAGVEPVSRCGWRSDLQRRGGARPRAEC